MEGEVIYFDADRGIGFITGRDGNRYVFDRADAAGAEHLAKGVKVRFSVTGDRAREIQPTEARRHSQAEAATPLRDGMRSGSVPAVSGAGQASSNYADVQESTDGLGVFGYFRRCVTSRYFNFSGRARRKEFWSFAFISIGVLIILTAAGIVIDIASGNLTTTVGVNTDVTGTPHATIVLSGLAWLVLVVPSLAVTVRRIHDLGLAGWFILLNFVPWIGSLIILVFTLIPSQRHPNKWGPVPAGIRL